MQQMMIARCARKGDARNRINNVQEATVCDVREKREMAV